jgi:hypothetical protein
MQRGRGGCGPDRYDAADTGEVDRHARHRRAAVDVTTAGRFQGRLLPADAAEVCAVEEIDEARLAREDHLAIGEQNRCRRHVKVLGVVRGPGARPAFPWYTVQALEAAGPDEAAATAVKPPAISQAAAARVSGARGSPPMATR